MLATVMLSKYSNAFECNKYWCPEQNTTHIMTSARILIMLWGVMKIGNIVPRMGIGNTTLALRANVVTIIPTMIADVTHA